MTRGDWPWGLLGIERTADARAIRRAYAATLKAGDYDTDAESFTALREARDAALWDAEHGVDEADEAVPADAVTADAPPVEHDAEPALLDTSAPWQTARVEQEAAFDRHARQLEERLFAERDGPADEAEVAAMRGDLDALLADPQMDDITTHARVEEGLAHVLADAAPVSHSLIERATAFFGWDARADDIHLSPAIAWLMQRRRALAFRDAARQPGHTHHKAWVELTTPASQGSGRELWFGRKRVRDLLAVVRRDFPELEIEFDGWRVGLWENKPERGFGWVGWWLLLVSAFHLMSYCARLGGPVAPPAPVRTLSSRPADISAALQLAVPGAPDAAALSRVNPALSGVLDRRWQQASTDGVSPTQFVGDTAQLLSGDVYGYFAKADYTSAARFRRWQRDAARAAGSDAAACLDVFKRFQPPPGDQHERLKRQRDALFAEALAKIDGIPDLPNLAKTTTVPGTVVARTRALAGLSSKEVTAAFVNKGPPANICRAQIALIDAALEAPRRTALPILRSF